MIGCFWAANWQWSKGAKLAVENGIILRNENLTPIKINLLTPIDPIKDQWRIIRVVGKFDFAHQFLIKNQYSSDGQYGFHVAQLFQIDQSATASPYPAFWIDRGWVAAGASANSLPKIPPLPKAELTIDFRIRSEALIHEVRGSFIATGSSPALLKSMEHFQGVTAAPFYGDLVGSTNPQVAPLSQEQLPDLSTGPHYAYAFQWWLFALIALIGRIALLREAVKREEQIN